MKPQKTAAYPAVLSLSFFVMLNTSTPTLATEDDKFSEFGFEDVKEETEEPAPVDVPALTELTDQNIWQELYRNERAKGLKKNITFFYDSNHASHLKEMAELERLKLHPEFDKSFTVFLVDSRPVSTEVGKATVEIRTNLYLKNVENAPLLAFSEAIPQDPLSVPAPSSEFLWTANHSSRIGTLSANQMLEKLGYDPLPSPPVTLDSNTLCELQGHEYEALLNSPKPIFLQFGAHWCQPCQELKKDFEEVIYSSQYEKDFFVVFLDHDKSCDSQNLVPEVQNLFKQIFNPENGLEIPSSLPTLVMIRPGKHGKKKFELLNRDDAIEAARKPHDSDGKLPFFKWLHRLDRKND